MTESTSRSGFGPSALATPANAVTVVRLLVSPVLFAMLAADDVSWGATVLWAVLTLTDGLDGFIARRQGSTRSGAFLDPLADKVLVLGALAVLVATGTFWWLPVALIGVRELGISLYRSYWGRRGLAVPARRGAKVKTVVQELAVGVAICPPFVTHVQWLAVVLLWVAVALTLITGFQYLLDGRKALTTMQGPSGPLSGKRGPSGPLSGKRGPSGPLSGKQGGAAEESP